MLGAIIGDIVGSRFEFKSFKSTDFELFSSECDYTDDSICTTAIADAILNKKPYQESLLEWCRKYPNPTGAYGNRFSAWIHSENPQPYGSYGNGSAMRVSATGWLFDNETEVLKQAELSALPTHNHPEGILGAQSVALAIFLSRKGAGKEEIRRKIEEKSGYNLSMTCDEIRPAYQFSETCRETVPQAIIAFLDSENFEHAIRLAISLGGDADTLTAITGSIAEAYYRHIPENFKKKALEFLPNDIKSIVEQFYQKTESGFAFQEN